MVFMYAALSSPSVALGSPALADNLRYAFDYCVFGFPNSTRGGLGPCATSTACGGMEAALTEGGLETKGMTQYGYCDSNGSHVVGDPTYEPCRACVGVGDRTYLSNCEFFAVVPVSANAV